MPGLSMSPFLTFYLSQFYIFCTLRLARRRYKTCRCFFCAKVLSGLASELRNSVSGTGIGFPTFPDNDGSYFW